jgi:hypothetical protein
MPSRIGFSVWFFQILYAVRSIYCNVYAPPHRWGTVADHRMGAMMMLAAIFWAIEPATRALLGLDYVPVTVQPY